MDILNKAIREVAKQSGLSGIIKKKKNGKKVLGKRKRGEVIQVTAPAATSYVVRPREVRISSASNGNTVFKRKELIWGELTGSVNWQVVSHLRINPVSSELFPWLSGIARNFEFYRFKKLNLLYVTNSASSNYGSVQMAVEYNVNDPKPSNELQMSAYPSFVDGPIWSPRPIVLVCDPAKLGRFAQWHYVGDPLDINNLNTYDVGKLLVATTGCANTNPVGKLYVDYEVEFNTPTMSSFSDISTAEIKGTLISGSLPLGTPVFNDGSTGVEHLDDVGGNRFLINKPGQYIIYGMVKGTGLTSAGTLSADYGCTVTNISSQSVVGSATEINFFLLVEASSTSAIFRWTGLGGTSFTSTSLVVMQTNDSVVIN